MIKKRVASVLVVAVLGLVGLAGGTQASSMASRTPAVAQISRTCGNGTPARTPGGVKCLAPGEYCSHKAGYAAAYRRAGFRCKANGRLAYR